MSPLDGGTQLPGPFAKAVARPKVKGKRIVGEKKKRKKSKKKGKK